MRNMQSTFDLTSFVKMNAPKYGSYHICGVTFPKGERIFGKTFYAIFDGKTLRSFKMLYRRTERRFQNVLNLREYVTQVRESYEAEVDISLNTTMKIFTVVTTIFLPLTLIVGWYGMNFDMPEYDWKHGYLFVTLISAVCILAVIAIFKKKKWF